MTDRPHTGNQAQWQDLAGCPVFVTGATGFVGRRLLEQLTQAGANVTALLRTRHGARDLAALGVRVEVGALSDRPLMQSALRGQQVLFHLAYDMRAPATQNLADFEVLRSASETAGVDRIVHVSSIVVHDGWPNQDLDENSPTQRPGGSAYRHAKLAMEQALMQGNCPAAILQPTLVYGPHSRMWTDQLADWLARGTVVLPDPEGVCNGVFVDDLVQALLRAAILPDLDRERFIISGAAPFAWSDLLLGYARTIGRGKVRHAPLAALQARLPAQSEDAPPDRPTLAARVSAAARSLIGRENFETMVHGLKRRLPGRAEVLPDHAMLELFAAHGVCRIDKARARLGYRPEYDLAAGLDATRSYLESRHGAP